MPDDLQKIVREHLDLYNLGVHGPDIFFYDLIHKDVSEHGYEMHRLPARDFFENACEVYARNADRDEMMAYLLGFLSHFTLDSCCHGYVDRKKEVSGLSHNKIEAEYDAHLMRQENRKPNLVDRSEFLKPNRHYAAIIARFFPFDQKQILRALKGQRLVIGSLNCISDTKRSLMEAILTRMKKYDDRDLILHVEEHELCRDANLRLDKLKAKALKTYPKLLKNLLKHMEGEEKLSAYFNHDFGPWKDYQEIPILSYEEELKYKVK